MLHKKQLTDKLLSGRITRFEVQVDVVLIAKADSIGDRFKPLEDETDYKNCGAKWIRNCW